MNIKFVATTGLIATTAFAQSVLAAPSAIADQCTEPNCYAAIAATGDLGWAWWARNYPTQDAANAVAINGCNSKGPGCHIVITTGGPGAPLCIALASDGTTGVGPTADAANQDAMRAGGLKWESACNT